ncbi:glycosyltransferase [Jejubacter calystegiae]|uniref:Glycosyltransferase n=1 Tax=Jejubacter calystegiae TaxID=2579935 RepID=A0A4P8YHQ1_9ENTR|nr:glycosyltransferase [Jejubacter calystegiae]QCT19258.1 glycosyltransferase [Jejubacter calystegiae]
MIKKVVFTVTPIYSIPPKSAAAVETWIYKVAQRISIKNKIICIRNEGYEEKTHISDNCSIYRIKFGKIYTRLFKKWTRLDPFSYAVRITSTSKKFFDNESCDNAIIVHNNIKLFLKINSRIKNENIILHMHNMLDPAPLPENVKIIVPSKFLSNWYEERKPQASIKIVPNGFSLENYQQLPESQVVRSECGFKESDKIILFAGRFSPEKGIIELMRAVKMLHEKDSSIRLALIGNPEASIKGEKVAYQQEVKDFAKQNMTGYCFFLGSKSPDEMHKYFSLADLVAVPSIVDEAFCMVALEGMAAGKPVIVSPRGGMTEFVINGETGFHFSSPMSAESMASDLDKALKHPRRLEIASCAKNYAFSHYTWEHVSKDLERVLGEWF